MVQVDPALVLTVIEALEPLVIGDVNEPIATPSGALGAGWTGLGIRDDDADWDGVVAGIRLAPD
jgi:hypothetical protein